MNQDQQPTHGYLVAPHERDSIGRHTLNSLSGPEFTGAGAVFAPLRALPPGGQLLVLAVMLAVGMAGCTAAWVDYQDYTPSPNVCRAADAGVPAERPGSCIPRERLTGVPR
ncbi:hypothetical protein [Nocardia sp. bgisy134]|uniref:hypothetical protein n=1 Tax=Nocardia sp. bgisy134 TaxID=3413789 RepID=UPI003D7165A6